MTGLDKQLYVRFHKWNRHGHGRSIRKNKTWILAEFFDDTENVIPSTAIQAGAMRA